MPSIPAMSFHVLLLVTSRKPPRSCTRTYSLYRSSGVLEMVGQAVIGVRRSSMKASSLSSQGLRSGLSSMSYSLFRLSDFLVDLKGVSAGGTWLLNTGLAGVRGQDVGEFISKSWSGCWLCGPGDAVVGVLAR